MKATVKVDYLSSVYVEGGKVFHKGDVVEVSQDEFNSVTKDIPGVFEGTKTPATTSSETSTKITEE